MSGYTIPGSKSERNMESGRPNTLMRRNSVRANLQKFTEAKKEINSIYNNVGQCITQSQQFIIDNSNDPELLNLLDTNALDLVKSFGEKVKGIIEVIERNQMKCAFFGRTSNGKSTVINAMLASRVLPSGIGHTTNCFVQVQGTDQTKAYLLRPDSEEPQALESLSQLAHSLSDGKLQTDSLLRVYWPKEQCGLLREGVVLLDSPGVDVDPDLDSWIDRYCLDADVFILVANSESTLLQVEKKFFHRVSERLSKPNIFVLNNRWDASANEVELVDEVRKQHLERCADFLSKELKVCTRAEAEDRVYFVSAKEMLFSRLKGTAEQSPTTNLAAGWQGRGIEFRDFEKHFETILSDSATKTKFSSHAECGRELARLLKEMMQRVYESSIEAKDRCVTRRKELQTQQSELRQSLTTVRSSVDGSISETMETIERRVAGTLNEEIRRLAELVDDFDRPFHPDAMLLVVYKKELNEHLERQLGKKLLDACSTDVHKEVSRTEWDMVERFCGLVEESARPQLRQAVDPNPFEPSFHIDCRHICADFHEDISFHFSLSLSSLIARFLGTKPAFHSYAAPLRHAAAHQLSVSARGDGPHSIEASRGSGPLLPVVLATFPSMMSRSVLGSVIVAGILVKATGWRVLAACGGVYAGLYLYERLAWTNKAKERTFKQQYVDFASSKLRLMIDHTSSNVSYQAKHLLRQSAFRLQKEVEAKSQRLEDEALHIDRQLRQIDEMNGESKRLKNSAAYLDNCFVQFQHKFLSNAD